MSNISAAKEIATAAANSFPDTATFAANIVVFVAAVAAVVAGAWKAITEVKRAILEGANPGERGAETRVASAMLIETMSVTMWSESNRQVCETMDQLREELRELRHELELERVSKGSRR